MDVAPVVNPESAPAGGDGWQVLKSSTVWETPWLRVVDEVISTPTRPEGVPWVVAFRPVAAVVAPRTRSGHFLLIRQERLPVRRELWEFPAGQVEGPVTAASIEATARRELGEEAGVACPGALLPLGHFFSSVGFTDECAHLFLAVDVEKDPALVKPDEHEAIHEVREFSPSDLRAAIARGEIVDANTLAVFARLTARELFP